MGYEEFPCYKGTCNPGLVCVNGFCVPGNPAADGVADMSADGTAPDWWPSVHDQRAEAGKPDGPVCTPKPPRPVLDSYPSTTNHLTLVLRGKASGGATSVLVNGGITSTTAKVSGGRFCAEVKLAATYAAQTFTVAAVNSKGCHSDGVTVAVTYKAASGDINLLSKKVGKAFYRSNFAGYSPTNLGLLTDGKLKDSITFTVRDSTTSCDRYTWVWYDLKAPQVLKRIVIKYPSNTLRYMTCWALVGTNKASPGTPSASGGDWKVLLQSTNGTPDSLTLNLVSNAQKYRHYAVLMFENNEFNASYEHFSIVEVEGWGRSAAPTCGN